MDLSQPSNSTRDSLRKIREEIRETKSLEILRQQFEQLQTVRRQSLDDFDLQVLIADIQQEIVERFRYLRGDTPAPLSSAQSDHSVIFQIPVEAKQSKPTKPAVGKPTPTTAKPATPTPSPNPPVPPSPTALVHGPSAFQTPNPSDAAEIPPEVTRVDAKSWQMIVGLAAFLCLIVLAAFFYLIQTARKINIAEENHPTSEQSIGPKAESRTPAVVTPPVSLPPILRLYTDLAAGTVAIDGAPPRSLVEGELVLDNLPAGQHSIQVTGSTGSASFQFEIVRKNAPTVIGVPQVNNALAVLVSGQDGHGQLVTSPGPSEVLLDGKSVGQTTATGLELLDLGTADHDLQVVHDRDRQRFVMTYTPAPVLTVYVKSDPNTGILQVTTGVDGAEVFIENTLFRRKTERGQIRISVRAGQHSIRVHKDGFIDPPPQTVDIKKADVTQAHFELAPLKLASLQIHGAPPGTTLFIDQSFVGAIGPDGSAKVSNIRPGEHAIELPTSKRPQTHAAYVSLRRMLTLAGADVTLEKTAAEVPKPLPAIAPPTTPPENYTPAVPASPVETPVERSRVQKGGGFVPLTIPQNPPVTIPSALKAKWAAF